MTDTKKLMDFGRSLPSPFDSIKKKQPYSSMYGDGTQGTLCASILKMLIAAAEINSSKRLGGYAECGDLFLAEYKSAIDSEYHLVVYNPKTGSFLASVMDVDTSVMGQYSLGASNAKVCGRDGAALMLAMFQEFLKDQEFNENFDEFQSQLLIGFSDMDKTVKAATILCDNVYRRLNDDTCAAYVKTKLDKSGRINSITYDSISRAVYDPDGAVWGEIVIFSQAGGNQNSKTTKNTIDPSDFERKYTLSGRKLTVKEEAMVPKIPTHIIISDEAVDICQLASGTTGKVCQQRNFLLRGGAGSGKSCTAKQVAAGLGLPFVTLTCHPDLSMDELIGQMLPITEESCSGDAEVLDKMGGINAENIAKLLNLPEIDEMEFEPAKAYKALTGKTDENATPQDCFKVYAEKIANEMQKLSLQTDDDSGMKYQFIEGILLQAIKYGWVVELQEPTVIARPGVLAGLNSILEQEGNVTLPDGRVIVRHPDAVVICTTNIAYEGCRGLNQSVLDRMSAVYDVETPSLDLMVERAMSLTGEDDEELVRHMAEVVNDVSSYCKENEVLDGITGMRVLIDWVNNNQIKKNPYKSALNTVVAKATNDEEERIAIRTTCLEPFFSPNAVSIDSF